MSMSVCTLSLIDLSGHVGLFCSTKCILSWLNEYLTNKIYDLFILFNNSCPDYLTAFCHHRWGCKLLYILLSKYLHRDCKNYLWMREGVCFERRAVMWGMLYMVQSNPVQGTLLYMGIVFRWTTAPRLGAPCWGRRVQSRGRGGGVARPSQARLPRCQLRSSVLDKHVQCPHLECLSLG